MLRRTLCGVPEAVESARAWIEKAITTRHLKISAAEAVHVGGVLIAAALRHTPKSGVVEIRLIPARSGGLIIEVKDPSSPATPHIGGWAEISCIVRNFGTSTSARDGHIAWCELSEVATA